MQNIIIVLLIITVIGLSISKLFERTKKKEKEQIDNNEIIETIDNYYPYRMKYLLTQNEYYFFHNLKQITDPINLQILAKIRLADLIEVDTNQAGNEYMKYFSKIKSKHIDFAITDNMKIIALIELDDSSHQRSDRAERDIFVNNALLKVGYTVIRTNGNVDIVKQALTDRRYYKNFYQG